jgi:Ca2+-binding EF-hand superfamily protein
LNKNEEEREMEKAAQKMINEFDLTGNGVIGPSEFFNLVMAQFE